MNRLAVTFALTCACLALAAPAQAGVSVGVADDQPVGTADDGAAFFAVLNDIGLREARLTVNWDPTQPGTIENQAQIESLLPVATLRGIRVIFAVMPAKARSVTSSPEAAAEFAAFLQLAARTFPPSGTLSSAASRTNRASGSRSSTPAAGESRPPRTRRYSPAATTR
jgi:hypothetical protein